LGGDTLLSDFVLIQHDFGIVDNINIYPIGDVHIGSKECNIELFRELIKTIESDPNGYAVIIGDMMNMGLRNSKSNVYEEVLNPMEQKELCYELLQPIANKILAGCSGNHEYRQNKEVGSNPLYDVFCRLRIEDRYRENACFLKLTVGKSGKNPNTYGVVLTHGSSKAKDEKWTYSVDGCDCFISGHTHTGTHQPLGKIKMDLTHNKVKTIPYQHIVVMPFQSYGGYAIRGKYMPCSLGQFQRVTFDGTSKRVGYTFN
jgi:UDP-2,3-diacylglucosamine pyrophosphatase LpxH